VICDPDCDKSTVIDSVPLLDDAKVPLHAPLITIDEPSEPGSVGELLHAEATRHKKTIESRQISMPPGSQDSSQRPVWKNAHRSRRNVTTSEAR
jgi:hypothetical protein